MPAEKCVPKLMPTSDTDIPMVQGWKQRGAITCCYKHSRE